MKRVLLLFSVAFGVIGTLSLRHGKALEDQSAQVDSTVWNARAESDLRMFAIHGDPGYLTRASEAVRRSLSQADATSNAGGLLMRARLELASHRFAEARLTAETLHARFPDQSHPLQLLGAALFNLGEYREAERLWHEATAREGSSYGTESRLAQLDLVYGRKEPAATRLMTALDLAGRLNEDAPEAIAWCRVQLGELAFRSGDWEQAETHYRAAREVLPEYYSAAEHLAELRGAQGRIDDAVKLYELLIKRTGRPELMQALGDLQAFAGRGSDSPKWHQLAEAEYKASVKRGEVSCFHHLAGFYADSVKRPEEAILWARRDLELRHGIQAWDALAWALCQAGQMAEAGNAVARALETGTRDAHILYHAGMIRMSAGDIAGGTAALRAAASANPRHQAFHVHR